MKKVFCPSCKWTGSENEPASMAGFEFCPECNARYVGFMPEVRPTKDAPDGAKAAATESGLYNCHVCGQEKCATPGICDDCLAPPTEFEVNHWGDEDAAPQVI